MKMKRLKVIHVVQIVLLLVLFSGCSGIQKIDTTQLQSIDLSRIEETDDLSALKEMAEGKPLEKPLLFKVPKGFSLPVQFQVNTPLAHLDSSCGNLVFSQDLFLYLTQSAMFVSPDMENWASWGDFDAIKELFGWSEGRLAVGIGATRKDGALLGVKIGVNRAVKSGD